MDTIPLPFLNADLISHKFSLKVVHPYFLRKQYRFTIFNVLLIVPWIISWREKGLMCILRLLGSSFYSYRMTSQLLFISKRVQNVFFTKPWSKEKSINECYFKTNQSIYFCESSKHGIRSATSSSSWAIIIWIGRSHFRTCSNLRNHLISVNLNLKNLFHVTPILFK